MKKLLYLFIFYPLMLSAQTLEPEYKTAIGNYLTTVARKEISVGKIKIDSVAVEKKQLQLYANINASYIPFREDNVKEIYQNVRAILPAEFAKSGIKIFANKKPIEELVPLALQSKKNKKIKTFSPKVKTPLITRISETYIPTSGLQNRHIALWQSHGYYFEQKLNRWEWQRARIFQTVEDLYTQSYVLPFLVPMLENAGANVLMPRERDTQNEEIIVDNDPGIQSSTYTELNGSKSWSAGNTPGFAQLKKQYVGFENPFRDGNFRQTETVKKGNEATAEWNPQLSKSGKFAVYISYQTLPKST